MPNWCNNNLSVSGDKSQIEAFLKKSRTLPDGYQAWFERQNKEFKSELPSSIPNTFSFSGTVPMPKEILEKDGAWYNWCRTNWGTKWDIGPATKESPEPQIDFTDGMLAMSFDTAWGPPLEWLEAVSALYPELNFQIDYEELGMCFRGCAIAENGSLSDHCEDISEEEIEEMFGE